MKIPATIRAILFDMDGVLLLSGRIHEQAFRQVLQRFGVANFVYDDYAGMRTKDVFQRVLAKNAVAVDTIVIEELAREKTLISHKLIESENPIAPGADAIIRQAAVKFRLGLASSASRLNVDTFLMRNRLRDYFSVVVTGADIISAKPSPEIYLHAAKLLGYIPTQCLVIEDAVSGVLAGRAAGMRVWGIGGAAADLTRSGAECVFPAVASLRDAFSFAA